MTQPTHCISTRNHHDSFEFPISTTAASNFRLQMERSLLSVPNEILSKILKTLHARDILACSATCRHLRACIADSVSLQYTVELFGCGMLDGARGMHTLSVQERLKRLQLYTAAWEKLLWTNSLELPHLVGCKDTAATAVSGDTLVLLHSGPTANVDAVSRLWMQQLPSELCAIDEHHYIAEVPCSLRLSNVKLDPTQELVVVSEGAILRPTKTHVHSMLTGGDHPLAAAYVANNTMSTACQAVARIHDICGDFLLEANPGPSAVPKLRNWKTGIVEASWRPTDVASLAFLDRRHIICISNSGRDLTIPPHLYIMPLTAASPSPPSYYEFALPESMQHSVEMAFLATSTLGTDLSPGGCFYSDPAERLISIALTIMKHGRRNSFLIDVPASTLTRYIAAHPLSPGDQTVLVPWSAWGTHGARVTVMPQQMGTLRTSGSRRAILHRQSAADGPAVLTVLDYSPRRVARAIARGTATVLQGAEVGAEHTGADFGVLRTTLPCTITETILPEHPRHGGETVWLCENGVVFVHRQPFSGKILDAWAHTI
ncbi:hypothetical protein BV25DRAFT_1062377 [Artomyces pyxidatus]|uniref:Uncharacterized protein n=1 Tax=Artomyces pyxidatus TaxID=48021 RepID=A0ACB8STV9_9AGAM|nr:hypothetical protein BV25DRAFT_1062377 [Artomyces pyxidatus]